MNFIIKIIDVEYVRVCKIFALRKICDKEKISEKFFAKIFGKIFAKIFVHYFFYVNNFLT